MILIENHQDKTDKEAVFVILFHNPVGNLKEMGRNFILTGSLETSRRHMENAFSPQKKKSMPKIRGIGNIFSAVSFMLTLCHCVTWVVVFYIENGNQIISVKHVTAWVN